MSLVENETTVTCDLLVAEKNLKISTVEDAKRICDAIRELSEIKTLKLEGISLGIEAAEAIADAISECPTLENCLWGDCFKGRMLEEIPPALIHLSKGLERSGARIRKLDLSDNAFGPNGATGVKPMLCTPAVFYLEELLLNNCGLGVGGGQLIGEGLEKMNENIRQAGLTPKLRVFIAGRNRQEVGGSAALAKGFKQLGSLEEVTLHQNGITWQGAVALSNAFKECPMKLINLNDNILTEKGAMAIAEAVAVLPDLEVLDLGDCLVRDDGLKKLATALTSCHSIRRLNFAFGEVRIEAAKKLIESIPFENMEKLDLNGNKFGEDGCEEILDLAGDLVGDLDDDEGVESDSENENAVTDSEDEDQAYQNHVHQDESLINQLITTGCMKGGYDYNEEDQYEEPLDPASTVDFNMKGLKVNTAADAQEIINAIDQIDRLVTLRLVGNTISPEGAKAISEALENRVELQHLLFADIFTGRLKDEIPKAVEYFNLALNKSNCRIRTLELSDNAFGPNGAVAVEPWLNSPCCLKMQILKLNNTGLGVHGGRMIANGLKNLHQLALDDGVKLNLKEFVCGRSRQEVGGTKALAEAFSLMGTLESIELPQNGILVEGITALAKCIESNPNLTRLNINDNTVTEKGALAIGEALSNCKNLATLDMGDCLIRNKGALYLSQRLSSMKSLRNLNLSYNEIRLDGGLDVGKAIESLPVFEKLNLNGNQFGEAGCDILLTQMEDSNMGHKLDSLDEDNEPDDDDEDENEVEVVEFESFRASPSYKTYQGLGSERDEIILSNCPTSTDLAVISISIIQDYPNLKSNANQVEDIRSLFHKLMLKLFSNFSEAEATTQILTEVGLLKAESKERQKRITKNPKRLQNLYIFLIEEVTKAYFPKMAKKYLNTFFSNKKVFKLVDQSDCIHRNELVALLFKF